MSQTVKEGWLKKWSPGKNQWTDMYCKLLNSRWFQWFDSNTSMSPKRSVDVAIVSAFLAFGEILNRVPSKPASVGPSEIPRTIGIPHEPHMGTKMSFFIAGSDFEAQSWIQAINSVLQVQAAPSATSFPASGGPGYPSSAPSYPASGGPGYPSSAPSYPASGPGYPTSAPGYPSSGNQFGFNAGGAPPPYGAGSTPYPTAGGFPGMSMPSMPPYPAPPTAQPTYPSQPHAYPTQAPVTAPANNLYPTQQPVVYQSGTGMRPAEGQVIMNPNGQAYKVVVVDGKKRKKKMKLGNAGKVALGGLGGLATGMLVGKMFGGGWGGGCYAPSYGYGGYGGYAPSPGPAK
ncbi:hypothetical protein Ciccas_009876, partial [Cichlidogyrus casuarinus]